MGGSSTYKGGIRSKIPVGFNHHSKKRDEKWMPKIRDNSLIISLQYDNALKQIGTLGGGNHFIEIQKGSDGYIWFMVHSGSRNIGNKVAKYYNGIAKNLNEKWFSIVPKKWELAFLPINSEEGYSYIEEMNYCVNFALNSRTLMIEYIKESILEIFSDTTFSDIMDIAHNYAAMENHFGQNVMVHRKGATRVREEEIGIIPGSQGTSSFIVKGLGNKESFMSCSHGAGRKMSRTRARNELNLEEEIKTLDNLGIIHSVRNQKDLDESSNAYKDIHTVMKNQEDLVEIIEELKPLAVIKG
ncbi:MAG: RtcB family protein [archaeon]